jgi:hypothetical protein
MSKEWNKVMNAPRTQRSVQNVASPPFRASNIAAQLENARSPADEHNRRIMKSRNHSLSNDLDKVIQDIASKRIFHRRQPQQENRKPQQKPKSKYSHSKACVQQCRSGRNEVMWVDYPKSNTKRAFIFVAFEYDAVAGTLLYGATICNKQSYPADLALHARTASYRLKFLPVILREIWCTCSVKWHLPSNLRSTIRNMMRAYGCHDTPHNNQSTFPPSVNETPTVHAFNPRKLTANTS